MSERIITTFTKGKKDCDHKWTYSTKGQMQMTFPQKFICARICENCGQHEMVELDSMPKSTNNFTEIVKQFQKDK